MGGSKGGKPDAPLRVLRPLRPLTCRHPWPQNLRKINENQGTSMKINETRAWGLAAVAVASEKLRFDDDDID